MSFCINPIIFLTSSILTVQGGEGTTTSFRLGIFYKDSITVDFAEKPEVALLDWLQMRIQHKPQA